MYETYEEQEQEQEQQNDGALTTEDFIDLAKAYLSLFFRNKVDEHGFTIELEDLLTRRNVSMVLNLNVCEGVPLIYEALKSSHKEKRKGKLSEEINLVLKLLNECSRMSVPKNFATGLVAVYIEKCKGLDIDFDENDFEI